MRHKWVKRVMALLLAAMVFSLTACGSSSSSSSDSDSDSEEEEEVETEGEEENEDAAEEISVVIEGSGGEIETGNLIDTDEVSIAITGFAVGGTDPYGVALAATLTVEAENKTEADEFSFDFDYAYLNGLASYCYTEESFPEAGESAEMIYYLYSDENVDVGDLTDILLYSSVMQVKYDEDGWYESTGTLAVVTTHIYPDGEENAVAYEREAGDADVVLAEETVKITFIGGSDEEYDGEWYGYNLNFYIENTSETDLEIIAYPTSLNGTELEDTSTYYGIDLLAGTSGYLAYYLDGEYELADVGITAGSQLETVEILIGALDLETYEVYSSVIYTITLS